MFNSVFVIVLNIFKIWPCNLSLNLSLLTVTRLNKNITNLPSKVTSLNLQHSNLPHHCIVKICYFCRMVKWVNTLEKYRKLNWFWKYCNMQDGNYTWRKRMHSKNFDCHVDVKMFEGNTWFLIKRYWYPQLRNYLACSTSGPLWTLYCRWPSKIQIFVISYHTTWSLTKGSRQYMESQVAFSACWMIC
jgi:hypothetical protein